MEFETKPYGVYIKTDEQSRITAINSSAFLPDVSGWMKIDEGHGDRYHHAQGNYLPGPLMDMRGILRYIAAPVAEWPGREALHRFTHEGEEWAVYERTQEEMDADYTPPVAVPDGSMASLVAEVAALRESNAQLQEALDLLLSGEVE